MLLRNESNRLNLTREAMLNFSNRAVLYNNGDKVIEMESRKYVCDKFNPFQVKREKFRTSLSTDDSRIPWYKYLFGVGRYFIIEGVKFTFN